MKVQRARDACSPCVDVHSLPLEISLIRSLACVLVVSSAVCSGQSLVSAGDTASGPTSVPKKPISFDVTSIDKSADPCTNFYQYACGNWMKQNPIPADQVRWGRFNELAERNNYLLYSDLKKAADAPATPLQKKYGDFFAACMNEDEVNQQGAKALAPELALIAAIPSNKDLAPFEVKEFEEHGGGGFFRVGVTQDQKDSRQQIAATFQGGIALPDRDYYLNQDERSKQLRDQYVAHVQRMFALAGDSSEQAAKEAADVLRIETTLAKGSMARVDMRDPAKRYHIMSVSEVTALSPSYAW